MRKKKAGPVRITERVPRGARPVAFAEPRYPTLEGLVAMGPAWSRRLVASVRNAAIASAAAALAACHSGEPAAPPSSLRPVATPPVRPPTAPPASPLPTTPPVATGLVQTGEAEVPHAGDPCPMHDDGVVIDADAAAQLPADERAHLHPLGGIGIGVGRPIGMGGGASAMTFARAQASVRDSVPQVQGSMDVAVVRRVIRRHLNEVRFCYEAALRAEPALAGDVGVRMVVSPTGAVTTSSVASSGLHSASAEECIVRATRRWAFPSTSGGISVVDEVFHFAPGD